MHRLFEKLFVGLTLTSGADLHSQATAVDHKAAIYTSMGTDVIWCLSIITGCVLLKN